VRPSPGGQGPPSIGATGLPRLPARHAGNIPTTPIVQRKRTPARLLTAGPILQAPRSAGEDPQVKGHRPSHACARSTRGKGYPAGILKDRVGGMVTIQRGLLRAPEPSMRHRRRQGTRWPSPRFHLLTCPLRWCHLCKSSGPSQCLLPKRLTGRRPLLGRYASRVRTHQSASEGHLRSLYAHEEMACYVPYHRAIDSPRHAPEILLSTAQEQSALR